MQYVVFPHDFRKFPQIPAKFPQNSLTISSRFWENIQIQRHTQTYLFIIISFAFDRDFPWLYLYIILDAYERFLVLVGSNLEKCGFFFKNCSFFEQILPDWGNTAWADLDGLGSIGRQRPRYTTVGSSATPIEAD